jgi:hypothetical protein
VDLVDDAEEPGGVSEPSMVQFGGFTVKPPPAEDLGLDGRGNVAEIAPTGPGSDGRRLLEGSLVLNQFEDVGEDIVEDVSVVVSSGF